MKINVTIEAILLGVTNTIIGNLNIGNGYTIEKDNLMNKELLKKFDYTDFGIRRIYYNAILDDKLGVAVLRKNLIIDNIDKALINDNHFSDVESAMKVCNEFEENEIDYLDKKMRAIRFFCENGFNIREVLFKYEILSQNGNIEENINSKRPFPDRIYNKTEKLNLDDYSVLNNFLTNFEQNITNSSFDKNLLDSVLFLYDQSYYAPVATLRFMVCVIGLESIFAKGNSELSYRLSRSVGMLLGNNTEDFKIIRDKMKKIYNKRSNYVHTGQCKNITDEDIIEVRDILRQVIKAVIKINKPKEELLDYLEVKGFEI